LLCFCFCFVASFYSTDIATLDLVCRIGSWARFFKKFSRGVTLSSNAALPRYTSRVVKFKIL
jgi:hypothetical protein